MSYMNSWATSDLRILINFSDSVLDTFLEYVQEKPSDREAGGLLLGTVHGSNMIITEATIPTKWDTRLRYFFERLPLGHFDIAQTRWKGSNGTIRYLGEWHTHPENDPSPSGLDRSVWNILAQKRKDNRPMLAVIVGRKSLYVELVLDIGNGSILAPLEQL